MCLGVGSGSLQALPDRQFDTNATLLTADGGRSRVGGSIGRIADGHPPAAVCPERSRKEEVIGTSGLAARRGVQRLRRRPRLGRRRRAALGAGCSLGGRRRLRPGQALKWTKPVLILSWLTDKTPMPSDWETELDTDFTDSTDYLGFIIREIRGIRVRTRFVSQSA
jgi:hypothetical protein